jgi:hypothetical protein
MPIGRQSESAQRQGGHIDYLGHLDQFLDLRRGDSIGWTCPILKKRLTTNRHLLVRRCEQIADEATGKHETESRK